MAGKSPKDLKPDSISGERECIMRVKTFLLHKYDPIIIAVDITDVSERPVFLPSYCESSWENVRAHFLRLGALPDAIDRAQQSLEKIGHARLEVAVQTAAQIDPT
jgi:hypothetical protein